MKKRSKIGRKLSPSERRQKSSLAKKLYCHNPEMTVRQIARRLGVSESWVYQHCGEANRYVRDPSQRRRLVRFVKQEACRGRVPSVQDVCQRFPKFSVATIVRLRREALRVSFKHCVLARTDKFWCTKHSKWYGSIHWFLSETGLDKDLVLQVLAKHKDYLMNIYVVDERIHKKFYPVTDVLSEIARRSPEYRRSVALRRVERLIKAKFAQITVVPALSRDQFLTLCGIICLVYVGHRFPTVKQISFWIDKLMHINGVAEVENMPSVIHRIALRERVEDLRQLGFLRRKPGRLTNKPTSLELVRATLVQFLEKRLISREV